MLAFVTQHLQSAPAPAPAAVPAAIDTTDASRSERLLLLLLDQLGVDPEAVQAAWRGAGESDIDLLVEFQPDAPEALYKTYFSFLNELRQSLASPIPSAIPI